VMADALPRNANGKVLKAVLKEYIAADLAAQPQPSEKRR
jgi:acyl-coenzyme A synthetase/AMP-(fatty) acid ligase